MKGKSILLISPESWEDHHVSKHHYATILSQMDNNVFFLNPPSDEYVGLKRVNPRLSIIPFKGHLKGLARLPGFIQSFFIARDVKWLETFYNVEFDVIWNFDSSRFYNLSGVENKLKICHIVDLNQDFKRNTLARTSDYCFCNSDPIYKRLKRFNPNVHKINHGISIETHLDKDVTLPGENVVKVVYAGNLDIIYLDHPLLEDLISSFPDVDFIFIGGYGPSNPLLRESVRNKFLIGKKEARELQSYYQRADALIVTYKASEYLEQLANPHKILEYLYSGKVVVATKTLEYDRNPLVIITDSREDFLRKFREVVENLPLYNSKDQSAERKAFALDNSYEMQITRIGKVLENAR